MKLINSFLKKSGLKIIPYTYVPPCPVCHSKATGQVKEELSSEYDNFWMIEAGLKNGELVTNIPDCPHNSYCYECGHTWDAEHIHKFINYDELAKEKADRHTGELLARLRSMDKPKKGFARKFLGY